MKPQITTQLRRWLQIMIFVCLFLTLGVSTEGLKAEVALADDAERTVVRVGYPLVAGLTDFDEAGQYCGYTYEYLQEISQYTGWEYEFVQVPGTLNESLTKMYEMLEKGELDLMGSTNHSAALDKIYDYPSTNYGSVYATLEVLAESTAINEANYQTLANIRIAVLAGATNGIAALQTFCKDNRINAQLVPCENAAEQLAALRANQADAMLTNDATLTQGTRIVARFNPKPFYFVTTEGNYEIISKLNSAMMMLNNSDPYFGTTLYQKYFTNKGALLSFTDQEVAALQKMPALRVGLTQDRLPLENSQDGIMQGVSADLLKEITKQTELSFTPVLVGSIEDLLQALQKGEIDLALGMTYDYNLAQQYNFSLSKPYISTQIIMVVKEGVDPYQLHGKRLALPRGVTYEGVFMGDVIWYDSIMQCLDAVNSGAADYCYGNAYSVEYYCNQYRYQNLVTIPQSSQISQYCLGVARPADPVLLNVLNKAIYNLPPATLQTLIYKNSMPAQDGLTLWDVIQSNPAPTLLALAIFMLLICALLFCFAWFQRRARRKAQIENERYQLLSNLSGEYLFEYDFIRDQLSLTEKTVQTFGGQPIQEKYYSTLLQYATVNEDAAWVVSIYANLKNNKNVVAERQITLVDGREIWLRITVAVISAADGRANYAIGKISDIQAEKLALDTLSQKAQTDGLTGLYNIAATRMLTAQALENSNAPAEGAFLILDIDHFKEINDLFGHYTGDQVLQDLGKILQQVFAEQSIVGRLGGDEFIVFMQGKCSPADVAEKCRLVQQAMAAQADLWQTTITLSIGATIVQQGNIYDDLYRSADKMLYAVKHGGRNNFQIAP